MEDIEKENAVVEDPEAEELEEGDEGEEGEEGEGGEEGEEEDDDDDDDDDEVAVELMNEFKADVIEDKRKAGNGCLSGRTVALSSPDLKMAEQFLAWLIGPLEVDKFYSQYWERKPFVIKRPKNRGYYNGWFHKQDIEKLLEDKLLEYGRGVDVTKYVEGERETLNGEGIADAKEVWEKYKEGCSVRVLHPQRWSDPLWLMLSTLERHWNCIAGCNAYLTPKGSQGFSPHYDDIEAFILQTEGKKHWRLYPPCSPEDVLPRFSSPNFLQEEIGEPILEVDLEPGDLLFMPRGTVHQAVAAEDTHSLHITISTGQNNSWADFLALAIPRAVEVAAEDRVELRRNLPRDMFSFMGVANIDKGSESLRTEFLLKISSLMEIVMNNGPWDAAVDQLAVDFLKKRMPLYSNKDKVESKSHSKEQSGKKRRKGEGEGESNDKGGSDVGSMETKITSKSKVRLVAPGIARLAVEEDAVVIYHSLHNTRLAHNTAEEDGDEGVEGEQGGFEERKQEGGEGGDLEQNDTGDIGNGKESKRSSKAGNGDEEDEKGDIVKKDGISGGKRKKTVFAEEKDSCCSGGACGHEEEALVSFGRGRLEFPLHFGDALDELLRAYPETIQAGNIGLDSKKECIALVSALVTEGLLFVEPK